MIGFLLRTELVITGFGSSGDIVYVSNVFVIVRTTSSRRTKHALCPSGSEPARTEVNKEHLVANDKHPSHLGCIGHTMLLGTPMQDQSGSRVGTDSNVFIHDQVEC